MFIKASKFEKLIKEAYKDGRLHIGKEDEKFMASGAGWSLSMVEDLMPKEMRAAVIKYVGWMPENGDYYLAMPDGDQQEVPGAFIGVEDTRKLKYAEMTRLAYRDGKELFYIGQSVNEDRAFAVRADLIDMIDETEIDIKDGETKIVGPFIDFPGNQIIVENGRMQLRLFLLRPKEAEAELLDFLGERDLNSFGKET